MPTPNALERDANDALDGRVYAIRLSRMILGMHCRGYSFARFVIARTRWTAFDVLIAIYYAGTK